jgi:hypothetical protein
MATDNDAGGQQKADGPEGNPHGGPTSSFGQYRSPKNSSLPPG